MSLSVKRSEWFVADLEHYADYYTARAGWDLAGNYLRAVNSTLSRLSDVPSLGHLTHFSRLELRGLRCMRVEKPFEKHLVFYRHDEATLFMERAIHGARDLPRRLLQPPESNR
jgi:toxin ParE1/3/4